MMMLMTAFLMISLCLKIKVLVNVIQLKVRLPRWHLNCPFKSVNAFFSFLVCNWHESDMNKNIYLLKIVQINLHSGHQLISNSPNILFWDNFELYYKLKHQASCCESFENQRKKNFPFQSMSQKPSAIFFLIAYARNVQRDFSCYFLRCIERGCTPYLERYYCWYYKKKIPYT